VSDVKIKNEDCTCDGGLIWNNGDKTSGQAFECDGCYHPPVTLPGEE